MSLVIILIPLLHHKIMLIFTPIQKLKLNSNQCLVWVVCFKLFSDEKFTETRIDGADITHKHHNCEWGFWMEPWLLG
jgi:hypothetical protein